MGTLECDLEMCPKVIEYNLNSSRIHDEFYNSSPSDDTSLNPPVDAVDNVTVDLMVTSQMIEQANRMMLRNQREFKKNKKVCRNRGKLLSHRHLMNTPNLSYNMTQARELSVIFEESTTELDGQDNYYQQV